MSRALTHEDFLSGEYDDIFRMLNFYSDNVSQYSPYNARLLGENDYRLIANTLPQFGFAVTAWQANIGQNGSSVYVKNRDDNTESTKKAKQRLQENLYSLVYDDIEWSSIQNEIVEYVIREGSCVLMPNALGQVIVQSVFRFNAYYDRYNKITRFALKDNNGVEVEGMKDLYHGEDIFLIKDPAFSSYPVPPSRLDLAYMSILLEQKGLKANTALLSNGFIMNVFLEMDENILPKLKNEKLTGKDGKQKSLFDRIMEGLNDRFRGFGKAGRVGIIPGLKKVHEIGKSSKDSQVYQIIKELTPERFAWSVSMTMADFGAGNNTTYNNAQTFNDALHDKMGRSLTHQIDKARNQFALKKIYKVKISPSFYIKYEEPKDPNKINEDKEWREDYKVGAITLNEYRQKRGEDPIEGGDEFKSEPVPTLPIEDPNNENDDGGGDEPNQESQFTIDFQKKKTPVQKALTTKKYKKFHGKWEKAISKQINAFVDDFSKKKNIDKEYKVKLPKIESYYSFNDLKKNILGFVDIAIDEVKKDKRVKLKFAKEDKEEVFGTYPDFVLEKIDKRTEALLKGNEEFASVDEETAFQIETVIRNNIDEGVLAISEKIQKVAPQLAVNRANLIAHQEVSNAIEGSRKLMYQEAFGKSGKKEWQTVGDDNVRDEHQDNEAQGKIGMNEEWDSGESDPSEAFNCRCTVLYYPE